MRLHLVDSSDLASLQRSQTKLLAYGPFLERLRGQGRERATAWIAEHFESVGRRSTIDVKQRFT